MSLTARAGSGTTTTPTGPTTRPTPPTSDLLTLIAGVREDEVGDWDLPPEFHQPYPHCSTMEWWSDAGCRKPITVRERVVAGGAVTWQTRTLDASQVADLFHPRRTDSPTVTQTAKKVCRECPVQMECLTYAIEANETVGIWGGLGAKERRGIARRRKIALAKLRVVAG